ncbi:MAG: AAA family ATPase [Candidatus Egerieousia sp.]
MTTEQKEQIRQRLTEYVGRYKSQNKAANSLKGISAGTVSSIINGKWALISDDMWMKLSSQLGRSREWQVCRTQAFDDLMFFLQDAREESSVMWVTGQAGIGKSTAAAIFSSENRNVFVLTCSEDMCNSSFIRELASLVGVRTGGLTLREVKAAVVKNIVTMESPLLIFDEGDKLRDGVLSNYVSLYNALEDKCGMVFLSTDSIEKKIRHGVERGKRGFDELESRIGRRFIPLTAVNGAEVEQICIANGLTDRTAIRNVQQEAATCRNDLRRVKRSIHKELKKLSFIAD